MAKKTYSIDRIIQEGNKSHLTKEEIESRQEAEEVLKNLATDKIKPPTWLSSQGKKIFKNIVNELEPIQLLANIDNYALAVLADAMDNYINSTKDVQMRGQTIYVTTKQGTKEEHNPHISLMLKFNEAIRKYSSEMGLTPTSRMKIINNVQLTPNEDDKEFNKDFGDV